MGDFENKKDEFVGKAKEAAGDVTDNENLENEGKACLLYTSPSPRDATLSRMPSSA